MQSSNLTSKKEVAALLKEAGIHPSKRLGQNFLIDRVVLDSIVNEVRKAHPREIVEIGAGLGTVTHELAGTADHIIAVELDRRLAKILERTVGQQGNVEIRRQDFLSFSLAAELASEKTFVVGNIPYRITAPILKHLVK
ncbi:MAG: rRNA adenine N-6-methyltransferase family protein, partial [Candidatus Bipolaricaulota bacterium]|nr:rRNA adenine N-6-methyltransferase family protein [Candidatus Bipolaricaulota bacterium]